MRRTLFLLGLLLGASACHTPSIEPLPFQLQLNVSRTATAPGDTVVVVVDAQGPLLIGVSVDYGDANSDQFNVGGARTAHVTFHHAYTSAGTFSLKATVTDASAGEKSASVDMSVH